MLLYYSSSSSSIISIAIRFSKKNTLNSYSTFWHTTRIIHSWSVLSCILKTKSRKTTIRYYSIYTVSTQHGGSLFCCEYAGDFIAEAAQSSRGYKLNYSSSSSVYFSSPACSKHSTDTHHKMSSASRRALNYALFSASLSLKTPATTRCHCFFLGPAWCSFSQVSNPESVEDTLRCTHAYKRIYYLLL